MENVVIIGSGCAGWTAALYTARANLKPLLLTGEQPGGLLTTTSIVENYPGFPEGIDGTDLMMRMQKQAERFGTQTRYGVTVTKVDFSRPPFQLWLDEEIIKTRSVIIATGASHRRLGIENEELLGRKGVTYCATCDGALPMFRNKELVVVGIVEFQDSACVGFRGHRCVRRQQGHGHGRPTQEPQDRCGVGPVLRRRVCGDRS